MIGLRLVVGALFLLLSHPPRASGGLALFHALDDFFSGVKRASSLFVARETRRLLGVVLQRAALAKKVSARRRDWKLRFEPGGVANRARFGDVVDILFIGLFRDAILAELGHASFGRFARLFFLLPILVELPALFVISSIV